MQVWQNEKGLIQKEIELESVWFLHRESLDMQKIYLIVYLKETLS